MEELLDLQLFAEGAGGSAEGGDGAGKAPLASRGAGSRSETEGMGRPFEGPAETQPGGGIPSVTAYRRASSPFAKGEPLKDGDGLAEQVPGRDVGTGKPAPYTERDRAAQGSQDGTRISSASNRNAFEQERDRAAQGSQDDTRISSALKKHFRRLEGEAEQMREVFPGFDLRQELRDPRFAALTAPGMGVSVEDAYYALHRRELQAASMQVAARSAARKLASSIQSAARRPVENGGASAAPAGFSLRHMSKEQREELRQRIRTAAALGTKIYP